MQRTAILSLLLSAAPLALHADSLTEADREALIEKLDGLRDSAKQKAMGRLGVALSAYREAMQSDEAAMAFYLKCVEKVEFDDQKKSSQEFREWKRRQEDRLKQDGLGRCLRHQLRWLVLTLEAAEAQGNYKDLAPKASAALDDIFGNPDQFGGNANPLREAVTSTVFARAYNIANAKVDNWPLSPLDISAVFNQVIFPPLRVTGKLDLMREQWLRRIRYEGLIRQEMSGRPAGGGGEGRGRGEGGRGGGGNGDGSGEHEKFLSETLPDLKWQMEEDMYRAGDQQRAAVNMLALIEANLTHPKAREWADRFRTLIDPPKVDKDTAEKAGP
ncbi:hypothetical protein OKA04_07125 [Luteolibacter flavescens]|uniref:Uncharacterized protein n=1 Tax=Luteolibacter flavescens TaxID=1859460 RepID=A0ABT3FLP0_9BACT|nr:hypothetical protein [Luteolibacter flavescens]MCW1884498.1 hypothetical protein [Luteolibacter flavescens]